MIFFIDLIFYIWAIFSGGLSMFLATYLALFFSKMTLTYINLYRYLLKNSQYTLFDFKFISRIIIISVIFLIIFLIPNYHFDFLNRYILFIKIWSGLMSLPLFDYLIFVFKYFKYKRK